MSPAYQYAFPKRQLVSQADSAKIETANVPRSTFQNRWTRKTAFDAGYLVPFLVDEILPGDHMKYNITAYLRMATPTFPIFDEQRVDTHIFFVPNRILWDNWTRMMGEQPTGSDQSINFMTPYVETTIGGEAVGSIYDHMGVVVFGQVDPAEFVAPIAFPFRAYNLIFNEWFRDENQPSNALTFSTADGPDTSTWYNLVRRAKSHDFFTSALLWPQKFTAPTVPIGGQAPVTGIGALTTVYGTAALNVQETQGPTVYPDAKVITGANFDTQIAISGTDPVTGFPLIYADLSAATGIAINVFRQAWMVQTLLERDARGGTRYVELIWSHFKVRNPDFRLQRPEYIGGGQTPLNITPIAQTAPTTGVPLGAIGGAGTAMGRHSASYAATEHGWIIGLISVKSELSYQQGMWAHWKPKTRYEYYWPALAQLGEQAIYRGMLYATGNLVNDSTVFGYQEAWQYYRTRVSEVVGIMRSTAAGTLDAWHLAQFFGTPPALNTAFLVDDPDMSRVLAAAGAATGQQYIGEIMYERTATRPIPTFGTPAILGRF